MLATLTETAAIHTAMLPAQLECSDDRDHLTAHYRTEKSPFRYAFGPDRGAKTMLEHSQI